MSLNHPPRIIQCGREFTDNDIKHIRETVELFVHLSRRELAQTLCEHFAWYTASGGHKRDACLKLLDKLEGQGVLRLPAARPRGKGKPRTKPIPLTERTQASYELSGRLADYGPVSLEVVLDKERAGLFAEYVERYHYLGYKAPIGCRLRYFIICGDASDVVGCLLLAGASRELGGRDRWIGWTDRQRLQNLPWVINNSRFLLFPFVHIRHLASHVLGLLARRVREDWYMRWGYKPVLMETFVDPKKYAGTCYRAAGWVELGMTTGEGLRRRARQYSTTPKMIYMRPLVRDFRKQLCGDNLVGRVDE